MSKDSGNYLEYTVKCKTLILTYFIKDASILTQFIQNLEYLEFIDVEKGLELYNPSTKALLTNSLYPWRGYYYADYPVFVPDSFASAKEMLVNATLDPVLMARQEALLGALISPSAAARYIKDNSFLKNLCKNKANLIELRLEKSGVMLKISLTDEALTSIVASVLYYALHYRVPPIFLKEIVTALKALLKECPSASFLPENEQ